MRRFHYTAAAAMITFVLLTAAVSLMTFEIISQWGTAEIFHAPLHAQQAFAAVRDAFLMVAVGGMCFGGAAWVLSFVLHRDGMHRLAALDTVWRHNGKQ